jgi:hypothetical protein
MIVGMAISTVVALRPTDRVPKERVRQIHHLCAWPEESSDTRE